MIAWIGHVSPGMRFKMYELTIYCPRIHYCGKYNLCMQFKFCLACTCIAWNEI